MVQTEESNTVSTTFEESQSERMSESVGETEPEKPIHVLADMIGESYEEELLSYKENGGDLEEWKKFLDNIGATLERVANGQDDDTYTVYTLYKQDKQLLLLERYNASSNAFMIKYRFEVKTELPDLYDIISMFEQE